MNLFSAAKTNKLEDDDTYHTQPQKEGGLSEAERMASAWPLVPACASHLINYKDSLQDTNLSSPPHSPLLFPPTMNLGVGKVIPNGRPK